MFKQLSFFPDPPPAPAKARPEAKPTAGNSSEFPNSSGIPEAPKRRLRFLALNDSASLRNRKARMAMIGSATALMCWYALPAVAQPTASCAQLQQMYNRCSALARNRYWQMEHQIASDSPQTRLAFERATGADAGPDGFARSSCARYYQTMWEAGCK